MKDYSLRNEKSRLIQATATSLHEHITELFDNGYDQGYEDGKKASCDYKDNMENEYNRGLNDAWEVIMKIAESEITGGYSRKMLQNIFDTIYVDDIVFKFTAQEAIAKIKEYEEQHEKFAVGDEVYSDAFDDKGIITHITADKVACVCIICNGSSMMKVGTDGLHKTGRHFDTIAEILAEMKGDSE